MTTAVALYARISEDTAGDAAGVERQLRDGRELAEARGWSVLAEHVDNDLSATHGKHRPGYQHVLDLVRAGRVQHVVVWQTSRLLRNRRERAEAIELFASARVGIITVKGQDLDLSTAYGRGMAGLLGEFDTMESEVKSERVAAAAADRARRGRPNGALGYGWTSVDGQHAEHSDQAPVVREVIARLLAGESLLGVTRDLNERGVTAPASESWGKTAVKKIALRPSNAGLRLHHRGRPTEALYPGSWPALVSRSEWERVTAMLTAPDRRTTAPTRPGARRHLLTSGVGCCGECGEPLRVSWKGHATYGSKTQLYVCAGRGCVGRNEQKVDDLVAAVVVARLSQPDALRWLMGDEDQAKAAVERVADLRRRLDDAADGYADDRLTLDQLDRITAKLRPQIEAAEAEHRRHLTSMNLDVLADLAGDQAAQRWAALTVAQRRAVVDVLLERVAINRASKRGPGFNPDDVTITWKGATS